MTTLKDRTRTAVLELDKAGNRVDDIAAMLGITMDRVERILELEDPAHTFETVEPEDQELRAPWFADAPHGTEGGYSKHWAIDKTKPCQECRTAHLLHEQEAVARVVHKTRKPCGTYAAYRRHRTAKQAPCDPCKAAAAARQAAYKAKREDKAA